jgi:transposase
MPTRHIATSRKSGRPTKLTIPRAEAIVRTLVEGLTLKSVSDLFGFDKSTLWRWRRRFPRLDKEIREAIGPKYRKERVRKRTLTRKPTVQPPRKYREEFCDLVQPSLRKTAARIGVHWITVHRWVGRYREFEFAQLLERGKREIQSLQRRYARYKAARGEYDDI